MTETTNLRALAERATAGDLVLIPAQYIRSAGQQNEDAQVTIAEANGRIRHLYVLRRNVMPRGHLAALEKVAEATKASLDAREEEAKHELLAAQAEARGASDLAGYYARAVDAIVKAAEADTQLRAALAALEQKP